MLKPIENKELIKCIEKLKEKPNKENEEKFFEEFKKSKVIVPVKFNPEPKTDKNKNLVLSKNVEINFLLIKDIHNHSYYPAFLDFNSFSKWKKDNKDVYNITFDLKGFYNLLNGEKNVAVGVAIDPFNLNIICNKSLINKLNGQDSKEIEKPVISDPKIYPTAMVNALYNYCEKQNMITKAYLKSLIYKDKIKFAIIVLKNGDNNIFHEMKKIAIPFSKGIELEFFNLDDGIVKDAIKDYDVPFFEK